MEKPDTEGTLYLKNAFNMTRLFAVHKNHKAKTGYTNTILLTTGIRESHRVLE
jgi:hypothetical protein